MNVPDALVITVVGLTLTQVLAVAGYLFKKLLQFERLCETVRDLKAEKERRCRKNK